MSACPEQDEDLSALLDGALDDAQARALEEHLARCAGCRAEREALELLVGQVRRLPRRATPPAFAASVMARVLEVDEAVDAERRALPADVVLLVEEPAPPAPATRAMPVAPATDSTTSSTRSSAHADPFTAPTVPVPAPGAGPRGPTCLLVADDLSAYVDGELPAEARLRVEAHLAACMACDADMWNLDRQRARLRALPRVRPHELFVRQLMARIDAEELAAADRGRRLAAERAQRVRYVGWALRAASLLGAVALSLNLTAPEAAPSSLPLPRASVDARARSAGAARREAAPSAPLVADDPPLAGAFDAVLELHAPRGLDAGLASAQEVVGRHARLTALRVTEAQRELGVQVAARQVDDLYRDLDALAELDGSPVAERAADAIVAEQDRVVLKGGVVLAGTIESDTPAGVVIVAAGLRQRIDRRRVERVERADQPRAVRVVITERP